MHHVTARSRFRALTFVGATLLGAAAFLMAATGTATAEKAAPWRIHTGATTAPPQGAPALRPQAYGYGTVLTPVNNPDIHVFPSANPQTEVSIAINPANPLNFLITSNTTPTNTGQGYYYSLNGAATFNGSDSYPNGAANFGDPVSAFDATGLAYDGTLGAAGGILISTSTDGGVNWGAAINIDPLASGNDDKEHGSAAHAPGARQNTFIMAWTDFGPTRVVATTSADGYAARRTLDAALGADLGQGVNVQWGPNNEAYVCWTVYSGGLLPGSGIGFTKSLDGGLTWTPAVVAFPFSGIRTSNGANPLFNNIRVNDFPWMAVDTSNGPHRGRIYITVCDRSTGDADIYVRHSDDQGATWSAAVRVNNDGVANGLQQYFPACAVDPITGDLSVSFYSHETAGFSTRCYVGHSTDGGNTFESFPVSDVAFLPHALGGGFAGGYQGDYIGITAWNGKAWPAWCDDRSGQYNVYTQEVVYADPTDPNAPTNVAAASDYTTPTTIDLSWVDPTTFVNGDPLTNFEIKISRDGTPVGTVASGVLAFHDSGLTDGQLYTYDLRTRETVTDSLSIIVSVSKYAGGDPFPGPPTAFSVAASGGGFDLNWTNPSVQRDGTPLDDFAGINVYRNGTLLTTLSRAPGQAGAADTYTDGAPAPGLNCYQLSAFDNESPVHESTLTANVCVEVPLNPPFADDFPVAPTLDGTKWSEVSTGTVDPGALNPPSPPYALNLFQSENATTRPINMATSGGQGYVLLYSKEQTGTGESPDAGNDLIVEMLNSNNVWDEVARHLGSDPDETAFTTHVIGLDTLVPSSGTYFHTQFRIRFRDTGDPGSDDWFVDNVNMDIPNCQPTMTVAPLSVSDALVAGTPSGSAQPVSVSNSCAFNALAWTATETPDVSWLNLTSASGVIGGTGSQSFVVNFNAIGLPIGSYDTDITVSSNDPVTPTVLVHAHLDVNPAPVIGVAPSSLTFSIPNGGAAETQNVTISNTGAGPLTFSIKDAVTALSGFGKVGSVDLKSASGATLKHLSVPADMTRTPNKLKAAIYATARNAETADAVDRHGLGISENVPTSGKGGQWHSPDGQKKRPKGQQDRGFDEHFPPVPYGQGGPDGAGYSWIDSDEAGGPAFNWVDITTLGADIGNHGDDVTTAGLAIGFPFSHYGTTFNTLNVCSNGFVSFNSTSTAFSNLGLPGTGPTNMLAALWDDLDTTTGTIYAYQDVANDRFIVEWFNVPQLGGATGNTFELILYKDGRIVYQYLNVAAPATSSTTGTQKDGTVGLQVAFNQAYLHNGLAVQLSQDASWLSAAPLSGTIPPGGSAVVGVTADPTGLGLGTYRANLLVNSNDPVTPTARVHVQLDVTGFGAALPLCDNFDAGTTLDPTKWINSGVLVDGIGLNEPSAPNSADFLGTASMSTVQLNTSTAAGSGYVLAYQYEKTGGGEAPDPGNDLIVEFLNSNGVWDQVARHLGGVLPNQTTYTLNLVGLDTAVPSSGTFFYNTFQFRIRATGDPGFDNWFVDNVCLDLPPCQPTLTLNPATIPCQTLVAGTTGDPITVSVGNTCNFAVLSFTTNIVPASSWIQVAPDNGTISGSGALPVDFTFNAIGLLPGSYNADVHFLSNDSVNPDQSIHVCLVVTGSPNMVVTPDSLVVNGYVGGPVVHAAARVSNTGPVPLNWQLADTKGIPAAPGGLHTAEFRGTGLEFLTPNATKLARFAQYANLPQVRVEPGTEVVLDENGNTAKGLDVTTDRRSQLQPFGQGGPDANGYRWIDSDQAGGPAFQWVELEGAPGTVDTGINGDDQNRGPFALGFNFPYYGTNYTSMRVCSNGWLSPTATTTQFTNAAIPTAAAPNNIICPFWDDLLPTATRGKVYFRSEPALGRAIFEWKKVPRFSSPSDTLTFQAILCKDGSIQYNYLRLNGTVNSATVGIENQAGTVGLQMVFNAAYLHAGLSVLIQAEQPWLSASPTSGIVAPGGSQAIDVAFDPTGVAVGPHRGFLRVTGDDPAHPRAFIPVVFNVAAGPPSDVCITCPPALTAPVERGASSSQSFTFCNCLNATDTYYFCTSDDRGWTTAHCDSVVLAPGECHTATLNFTVPLTAVAGDTNSVRFHVYPKLAPERRKDCVVRVPVINPPISVVLANLAAISTPEGVAISWETASESDHSFFNVLRSDSQAGAYAKVNADPIRGTGKYAFRDGSAVDGATYWYQIQAVDRFGVIQVAGQVTVTVDARPKAFALAQNYPNPFAAQTAFRLDVPATTPVSVRIFDATGRLVKTMANGVLNSGRYDYQWNGTDDAGNHVAAGFYFLRAESSNYRQTVRMMLVK